MNKSSGIKALSCIMGAAAIMGGCAPAEQAEPQAAAPAPAPVTEAAEAVASPVTVEARKAASYDTVANVSGEFSFTQDVVTPADDVFNLFGTAATFACAKPGFAFDDVNREEYYINVSGNIKKAYTISLKDMERMKENSRNMVCSCGMSNTVANASVKGVSVADLVEMAEVDPSVNTITFKDDTGYGLPMPLSYVLDKEALLVYQIGGKDLPDGTPVQVWMPDTIAKYFTRRVTDIELTTSEDVPEVEGMKDEYRAKVNVLNTITSSFAVGDQIAFEGYADDCGTAIAAVEFSMDGGETWTTCETTGATGDQWVYWHFAYVADIAGTFKLDVRAVTEDGTVSPLASSVVFTVTDYATDAM